MPLTLNPEMWNGKRMFYFTDCTQCGVGTVPAREVRGCEEARTAKCPACKAVVSVRLIRDTHKNGFNAKPRHQCGPKCEAATGPNCECQCEGVNHGRAA